MERSFRGCPCTPHRITGLRFTLSKGRLVGGGDKKTQFEPIRIEFPELIFSAHAKLSTESQYGTTRGMVKPKHTLGEDVASMWSCLKSDADIH